MTKLRRDTQSSQNTSPITIGMSMSSYYTNTLNIPEFNKQLRIVCSGTLFLTHTLSIPNYPTPSSTVRAHAVEKVRGGSANIISSLLAQFPSTETVLVAPLGGNEEGRRLIYDLENEGVITQYCKIWPNAGVPSAWVLHSDDNIQTVINHNPLPDITHEDFISILGPLLAPENYPDNYMQLQMQQRYQQNPYLLPSSQNLPLGSGNISNSNKHLPNTLNLNSTTNTTGSRPRTGQGAGGNNVGLGLGGSSPRIAQSASGGGSCSGAGGGNGRSMLSNPNSPAPFDWLHFEGRSVKTTLNNMIGLDGLAKERKWRSHCVFSVDVGRKARQGVEALIPHADILFLNKQYAQAHSPEYAETPRAFLLSLVHIAPPHALLVAYWGKDGAAVLSLPTREYFQSSCWVEDRSPTTIPTAPGHIPSSMAAANVNDISIRSVRSGSDFWADGRRTPSVMSSRAQPQSHGHGQPYDFERHIMDEDSMDHSFYTKSASESRRNSEFEDEDEDDRASQVTSKAGTSQNTSQSFNADANTSTNTNSEHVDEAGAYDAFVAGMIYSLSRRICPGAPYTPSSGGREDLGGVGGVDDDVRGRWRLDECLRFATELSGRKGRRKSWEGLAEEMVRAGWFTS